MAIPPPAWIFLTPFPPLFKVGLTVSLSQLARIATLTI